MLTILQGDVMDQLRTLPDNSVHCCVTSPPYWGLRDYGTAQWEGGDDGCDHLKPFDAVSHFSTGLNIAKDPTKAQSNVGHKHEPYRHKCGKCGAKRIDSQLGLEKTPEEYVTKMVEVFREVRRVLRKDGTLWLNLGDSYAGGTQTGRNDNGRPEKGRGWAEYDIPRTKIERCDGLKPKDLCGIPWRVAFALQADGWWLRSDIIWAKPNPMPESVTDRPTKAHEYLFLLTKSANYFYDAEAIREQSETPMDSKARCGFGSANGKCNTMEFSHSNETGKAWEKSPNRNKRSVWTVATAPYPEAHFATYPPDLIKPCIMAGTSSKGCCAKCGSPWVRVVEHTNMEWTKGPKRMHDSVKGRTRLSGTQDKPAETKTLGWEKSCKCDLGSGVMGDRNPAVSRHDSPLNSSACRTSESLRGDTLSPLPIPCTVLDPFAGSGTTGAVAIELGRKSILIELNPKYVELIKTRCNITPGLQLA